jgi:uncharacterized protein with HEPN domain
MRDDRERLADVLEAITRIEKYAVQGRAAFEGDELLQNWIVRHLQILGEACRGLSSRFCDEHPEIPWSKIIGMRHILVHDYFGIDVDVVWRAVEHDLPTLKRQVQILLKDQ